MLDTDKTDHAQKELLRRIASGESEALSEFYDHVAGLLYSVAFRICNDPREAEEIIQDVFMQIWQKAALFDSSLGEPLAWAIGITRNRSIDYIRARQRQFRLLERLQEESGFGGESDAPPTSALGSEEVSQVRAAVKSLPEDQRHAIELAFFGGLSHAEIAERVEEPLGTVKARIRRGMLKLRDGLEGLL